MTGVIIMIKTLWAYNWSSAIFKKHNYIISDKYLENVSIQEIWSYITVYVVERRYHLRRENDLTDGVIPLLWLLKVESSVLKVFMTLRGVVCLFKSRLVWYPEKKKCTEY